MPRGLSKPLAITSNDSRFEKVAPSGASVKATASASAAAMVNVLMCMCGMLLKVVRGAASTLYTRQRHDKSAHTRPCVERRCGSWF